MAGVNVKKELIVVLWLSLVAALAGCKKETASETPDTEATTRPVGPYVMASPNPVPAGAGLGKATISWSTGDGGWGQLYMAAGNEPEKLFTAGPSGNIEAPWISKGPVYRFKLYAGKEHQKVIAEVGVTRN